MMRYYEFGLPSSNYHGDLSEVALGENNHISRVFIDETNDYGVRIIVDCSSEHDSDHHWYSIRDHKGDVFVAKVDHPSNDISDKWKLVWKDDADSEWHDMSTNNDADLVYHLVIEHDQAETGAFNIPNWL